VPSFIGTSHCSELRETFVVGATKITLLSVPCNMFRPGHCTRHLMPTFVYLSLVWITTAN